MSLVIMKEEGSSATDYVTDVTDVSPSEEEPPPRGEGRRPFGFAQGKKKEEGRRNKLFLSSNYKSIVKSFFVFPSCTSRLRGSPKKNP
ncbi:MAG: hypothetical protein WBA89_22710 [Microcoleus sp.]